MLRTICLMVFGLALFGLLHLAAAASKGPGNPRQAQGQQAASFICWTDESSNKTRYLSGVVHGPVGWSGTLTVAWNHYVYLTYHLPGPGENRGTCASVASDAAAQQARMTMLNQTANANKFAILHVDWQYAPDQPVTGPFICYTDDFEPQTSRKSAYRSGVFQAPEPAAIGAWNNYLNKTYGVQPARLANTDCREIVDPTKQQDWLTMMDQRAQGLHEQVVHVDFQYSSKWDTAPAPVKQPPPSSPNSVSRPYGTALPH